MSKKVLLLAVAVSILPVCPLFAEQVNSTWIATDGHWNQPDNWDPPIVPDNNGTFTFDVTIDGGSGDKYQVKLEESHAIDQLDTYGNVWLEAITANDIELSVIGPNSFTNRGNVRVMGRFDDAHHFKIIGNVTNELGATFEMFRTTIENSFYNARGATVLINYGDNFLNGVCNDGSIVIYPIGELSADANIINSGQIQMFGGVCATTRIMFNDVNGAIGGFGVTHSSQKTQNEGSIYASGGSLVIHTDSSLTNTGILGNESLATLHIKSPNDMSNFGIIESNLNGGITFDFNLVNEPNGTIKLLGGTLGATKITQKAGATFEGQGDISGNLAIDSNNLVRLTGPANIFGDLQIDPNATLEISDGTTLIKGHCTCNSGTIHLKGGWLIPQGGLTNNNCSILWEPGLYNNIADFNLDGKVDFQDFSNLADTWLWQTQW
jgi:hypothetical protein